jgi:hypothetical protein
VTRRPPGAGASVGPWPGADAIDGWRSDPGFRERFGRIRELLDDVETSTLDPVAWLDY